MNSQKIFVFDLFITFNPKYFNTIFVCDYMRIIPTWVLKKQ